MQRLRVSLLPIVAIALLALGSFLGVQLRQQQTMLRRRDRALAIVAASDATAVRLTAAPGAPAETHSIYRTRPGADLAIMTFSAFSPAPPGAVHQAWARRGGVWRSLGVVPLEADGHALVIVDQPDTAPPEALQVTLEPAGGSNAPTGSAVVSWEDE
jgi:hypothetical protein